VWSQILEKKIPRLLGEKVAGLDHKDRLRDVWLMHEKICIQGESITLNYFEFSHSPGKDAI
jgi:hypothetical protein